MDLWYEKPEFEEWNKIVQELANKTEGKLAGEYEIKCQFYPNTDWKWKLDGCNNFATVRRRKSFNSLRVSTKEEWATCAGVANLGGAQHSPKGWYTHPCTFWDLDVDNADRLEEIASILAKVCQARHH